MNKSRYRWQRHYSKFHPCFIYFYVKFVLTFKAFLTQVPRPKFSDDCMFSLELLMPYRLQDAMLTTCYYKFPLQLLSYAKEKV